jgi:hypothetical protein
MDINIVPYCLLRIMKNRSHQSTVEKYSSHSVHHQFFSICSLYLSYDSLEEPKENKETHGYLKLLIRMCDHASNCLNVMLQLSTYNRGRFKVFTDNEAWTVLSLSSLVNTSSKQQGNNSGTGSWHEEGTYLFADAHQHMFLRICVRTGILHNQSCIW